MDLNPYDRGDRLEPKCFVDTATARAHNDEDYGKVDFDDEEGRTIATLYFVKTANGYTLRIAPNDLIRIDDVSKPEAFQLVGRIGEPVAPPVKIADVPAPKRDDQW